MTAINLAKKSDLIFYYNDGSILGVWLTPADLEYKYYIGEYSGNSMPITNWEHRNLDSIFSVADEHNAAVRKKAGMLHASLYKKLTATP